VKTNVEISIYFSEFNR